MNYKLLFRTLGRVLQLEALCILLPMVVAIGYREDPRPFLYTILLVGILGTLLTRLGQSPTSSPGGVRRGGPELGGVEFVRRSALLVLRGICLLHRLLL